MWIRCHGSRHLERLIDLLRVDDPGLAVTWAGDRRAAESSPAVAAQALAAQALDRPDPPHATLIEFRSIDHVEREGRRLSLAALDRRVARQGERADPGGFRRAAVTETAIVELAALPGPVALVIPADLARDAAAVAARLQPAAIAAGIAWIDLGAAATDGAQDDRDRLACQLGELARWLGLGDSDSPLRRPLRAAERGRRAGHAASLAEASAWLAEVASARRGDVADSFVASYIERLAPALLPLSARSQLFLAGQGHRGAGPLADMRRFFAFVEARCSDARYARVQERFLHPRALYDLAGSPKGSAGVELVHPEKYLDLPQFAISKLAAAGRIGLRDRAPASVLDLGAGPGHFGLACEYLGHRYVGLDIPLPPSTPVSEHDLYAELFDCFGLERSIQRIVAFAPLEVARRFDVVTCLMGVFCTHQKGGAIPWQWPEWQFFLADLIDNVVAPRFEIYLHIGRQYVAPEVAAELRARGAAIDDERSAIRITDAQAAVFRG